MTIKKQKMTSANVIFYSVRKGGSEVFTLRQNSLCKSQLSKLRRFQPSEEYTIQAHGIDEHEAPWCASEMNLSDFMKKVR